MSRNRYQPAPFRDTYGLGFRPTGGVRPLERHRTIAAVCWDGDQAQFVNAAGLAVPCVAMDGLPDLLRRADRREYCKIIGEGQFAKPAHALKSIEGAGTLRKWVTYYFDLGEFCLYFDDDAAWGAYEQRELAELDRHYRHQIAELEVYRQAQGDFASHQSNEIERLEQERRQALTTDQERLGNQRRQALEQDQQLGAWLRGELPTLPLLRSVA